LTGSAMSMGFDDEAAACARAIAFTLEVKYYVS
jgi:hypothetical protein